MLKKYINKKNTRKILKKCIDFIKVLKKYFHKIITAKNKKGKLIIVLVIKYILSLFLAFCIFIVFLFFYYTYDLPMPEKFTETPFIQSTKIYDRTGKVLLYDIYGEQKREIVPFDKISDNLKHSVLASEDARFYQHGGIDLESIIRSVLVDLKLQSVSQGASTITQQLIRSVYLNNQKTLARKIREVVLSIELEKKYSKDQIFYWYLNEIPFGQNAYGVEAAAQTYFNKSASDLDLAQSAFLTALIPAPSYYSPYGYHKDLLLQRKDYILTRMKDLGYINDTQLQDAKKEIITFSDNITPIKAPHFVMYVQQYLEDKYGVDFLQQKGLKVYTTLDWDLQSYAQQAIKDADKTNLKFKANNTALVVIDPKTGEILSLVGSKDYFAKSYPAGCDQKASGSCLFDPQYDVATTGQRQPGSSFKPFVYATAFKKGYTPNTILWDVKTEFNTNCNPDGIDFPIPGNDDAGRAITLYCDLIARACIDGIERGQAGSGVDVGASENPAAEVLPGKFKGIEGPRGEADDLKLIKTINGKLEQRLNDAGVFHFWQIADLDPVGLALLDKTLRLRGQTEKETWIDQAKKLVAAKTV